MSGLRDAVLSVSRISLEDTGNLMTGECTAYLIHILQASKEENLADYTVFMHDDGPRHIRLSLLNVVLQGFRAGTYKVPFLHLVHERYPAFRTPCLKDVYRRVFGGDLQGTLSTYCCSHFIVGRDRILARNVAFYEHLLNLVYQAPYAKVHGGMCNVGKKPCYVLEFLWHRVFGEADDLPPRAEQPTLPLALRYEGGRASRLPHPLSVGPYMAMFRPSRYSSALQASR
eukprot:gnl/TRDRNA2_/TRDRNA2_135278_c4_seq2.p1 gnl/TRDRNA2_/TRDRNA2_135278_c4~~gnl/TRDRNA2_/TRDRNA2_135278_c4_seq2.p1  ORF type:complete len:228 (+),score=20.14 gnl/TRDRNA2_/TRDRNA2_135278_c4_seq2:26-709(+)